MKNQYQNNVTGGVIRHQNYSDDCQYHYPDAENTNQFDSVLVDQYNEQQQLAASTAIRTKLYVTNFPEDMDQEEMKQLFNNYGNVLECTIMWNQYAFVHFGSYGEAEKALIGIKGVQYKGYKISVQWSTSAKYQQPKQATQVAAAAIYEVSICCFY